MSNPRVRRMDRRRSVVACASGLWQSERVTVPFRKGFDERRGRGPPPRSSVGPTLRSLARADRAANLKALKSIRDDAASFLRLATEAGVLPKGIGDVARVGVEAAKVLALYSDGEPGAGNVPSETDEAASDSGELAKVLEILSQPVPSTDVAPPPVERGGDSGDEGQGNGGAA